MQWFAWLIMAHILALAGAASLFFLLPKGEHRQPAASGVLLGLMGLAGLLGLLPLTFGSMGWVRQTYFVIFAAIAIAATVRVVTHRKPVYSALYFVLTVLASAGLLLLVNAQFLGIAVIIIYAGAILVTYVFVIMLAQQGGAPQYDHVSREPFLASLAGFLVGGLVIGLVGMDAKLGKTQDVVQQSITASATPASPDAAPLSNLQTVGLSLIGEYAVGLEVAGLLLLVAMVGGLAIARRRAMSDVEDVG